MTALYFDGDTYDPKQDEARLRGQWLKVWRCIMYGDWWTLEALAKACGASEASVSARLRDFRKPRFGSHSIERQRVEGGLHRYRLVTEVKDVVG